MTLETFIEYNLAPVMGLLFLIIALLKNDTIEKGEKKILSVICGIEFLEMAVYDLELVAASWDHPTYFRILMSAIVYSLRPFIVYCMIHIIDRREKSRIGRILFLLPELFVVICAFSAFFTDISYSYNSCNQFIRGSLGYVSQFVTVFYMLIIVSYAFQRHIFEKRIESNIMLLAVGYVMLALALEVAFNIRSIGRTASVFSTIFFMYAIQTNQLKNTISVLQENKELKNAMEELKIARKEAERANAAKSDFLSRMSHDIRTPLNGIIGIIEINNRYPDDAKLQAENRQKAKVAANHLLSLINDVLELSKMEDPGTELVQEPFDNREVASDVFTIVYMKASDAGITLEYDDDPSVFKYPYVYGSSLHLRQIFLNIATNAVKYNKIGGKVWGRIEYEGKQGDTVVYSCTIRDNGIGMSEEFQKKIFDPFYQEHKDARSFYQGVGLGMSIVKSIVDKMGGTIEVHSRLGEGSTFKVTIPYKIVPESKIPVHEEKVEDGSIENMRILLVEDNKLNVEIAQLLLEDAGAVVTVADNGQEALNIYEKREAGSFDAILMELMMPVMDGYTATRRIRMSGKADSASIPIIAMTANAFSEDIKKCREAGMNAHLAKPMDIQKVIRTLKRYYL